MNTRDTLKTGENGHLFIGGADCAELAEKYGTPLYVYDKKYIEDICGVYSETLKREYGEGRILYASKAFSCKGIYKLIDGLGLGADVVSGGELYTALQGGIAAEKLVMHGNNKTDAELEYAVESGVGVIVCDAFSEIERLSELCKKKNVAQDVMLRVNPGVEAHTHHFVQTATPDSKFGFSIMNGDALKAVKQAIAAPNITLIGLHCHIGSQIFERESFALAADKMTDFYKTVKDSIGYEFKAINLGGGFGIYYTDEDKKLSVGEYAGYVRAIVRKLNECVLKKQLKKPFLFLEPGRSIVGEAGITLYTVGNVKEIKGIKNYAAVDGGMFESPRHALYGSRYTVVAAARMNDKAEEVYSVAGKCCESGDIIAEDCRLPKLKRGDLLAVLSTGAYNYSMASNYNRNPVPPVVIAENGKSALLVKPQSYEDIARNDCDCELL